MFGMIGVEAEAVKRDYSDAAVRVRLLFDEPRRILVMCPSRRLVHTFIIIPSSSFRHPGDRASWSRRISREGNQVVGGSRGGST
jgi:hypothetical protein